MWTVQWINKWTHGENILSIILGFDCFDKPKPKLIIRLNHEKKRKEKKKETFKVFTNNEYYI